MCKDTCASFWNALCNELYPLPIPDTVMAGKAPINTQICVFVCAKTRIHLNSTLNVLHLLSDSSNTQQRQSFPFLERTLPFWLSQNQPLTLHKMVCPNVEQNHLRCWRSHPPPMKKTPAVGNIFLYTIHWFSFCVLNLFESGNSLLPVMFASRAKPCFSQIAVPSPSETGCFIVISANWRTEESVVTQLKFKAEEEVII